jgi:hypothetical protein
MSRRLSEYRSEIITVPAAVRISMQSSGDGVDHERNGRDLLRAVGPMLANRPYRCELKYRYSISVNISGG